MDIDVDRLRWFVAVAEELHFGRAAAALNVSRLALSAAVSSLEAELETDLFLPGAHPTELTDAGRDLLERARPVIAAADRRRAAEAETEVESGPRLTVGYVPGVTLTKWTNIWSERFRRVPLVVVAVEEPDAEPAVRDGRVDMCFVRLPIDTDGLNVIPLYREVAVAVVPKDHPASMFEEVSLADLADENILVGFPAADAMDLVAGGAGIVIVPHSIARSHSRNDLTYRPVSDAPQTQIALTWPVDRTTDLTEEFVGVVRGRSERSSRSPARSETPSRNVPMKPSGDAPKNPAKSNDAGKGKRALPRRPPRGGPARGRPSKRRGR